MGRTHAFGSDAQLCRLLAVGLRPVIQGFHFLICKMGIIIHNPIASCESKVSARTCKKYLAHCLTLNKCFFSALPHHRVTQKTTQRILKWEHFRQDRPKIWLPFSIRFQQKAMWTLGGTGYSRNDFIYLTVSPTLKSHNLNTGTKETDYKLIVCIQVQVYKLVTQNPLKSMTMILVTHCFHSKPAS